MHIRNALVVICLSSLVYGCSTHRFFPQPDDPRYAPSVPVIPERSYQDNGSLFQAGHSFVLYEDTKANKIGDILTIVFDEETDATKSADTSIAKTQDVTIPEPTLLGSNPSFKIPLLGGSNRNLAFAIDADRSFDGEGESTQSNRLEGKVSVTVTQVLANGNLVVKGEKWITLNQGDEFIRLSGIVRKEDVTPENTVFSSKLANARITYSGRGAVADANEMGWVGRVINSGFWPF